MRSLPDGFDEVLLEQALRRGWALSPRTIDYAPVGFGSYHWVVQEADSRRFFVTVDDLDRKPWLGDTRHDAFDGLTTAYTTAQALADQGGVRGVVPPIASVEGAATMRVGERYAVAVFPHLDAPAGHFGEPLSPADRRSLLELLVDVHSVRLPAASIRIDVPAAGREDLDRALAERDRPWTDGPYAGPVRDWIRRHAKPLEQQLADLDRLALAAHHRPRVVTHGEPHPGNVLLADDGLLLIDWDTVALAPLERDLWLAADDDDDLAAYAERSGRTPDLEALALYRLAWAVSDMASYVAELRSADARTQDREDSWRYLTERSF